MIKKCSMLFLIICVFFSAFSVSAFTIHYDGIAQEYTGRIVTLYVNDEEIRPDMPAIILNSRTLVPARAVFEALGAEVSWIEREQKVIVSENDTVVTMTVNSDEAFVNNDRKYLDCPAKIINDRLLIPVRFAAEALGCEVSWDDSTACVRINKEYTDDYASDRKTATVEIDLENSPSKIEDFVLRGDNPRIVVDMYDAELLNISDNFENSYIKNVRTGRYSDSPLINRVVVDLEDEVDYSVVHESKRVVITVRGDEPDAQLPKQPEVSVPDNNESGELLVVIDAGHGGSDVGAVGKENGEDVLYEKDVNLAVSQYLNEYLKNAGVKTYMIRDTDVAVSIYDRPDIANELNASLYISVHSNSFRTPAANGTTVLYYAGKGADGQSKKLAQLIQDELVAALGTYDRGLMDGTEMYVIKNTVMPSVIVEMAFISNPDDRALLADDGCQKKAAQAIGRAVIKMLEVTE